MRHLIPVRPALVMENIPFVDGAHLKAGLAGFILETEHLSDFRCTREVECSAGLAEG